MVSLVNTCWGEREIDDKKYWHLVPINGMYTGMFKNNVRVGKGALLSVSAGIAAEPEIANAQTAYSLSRIEDKKEKVFEGIRQISYPHLPSRLKTLYVFDDISLVERALNEWFSAEEKSIHECRILTNSITHKADTTWLNCSEPQWRTNAERYWNGEMSETPFPEILVHGAIYFPGWEEWANA
jgi:hypothetical protein